MFNIESWPLLSGPPQLPPPASFVVCGHCGYLSFGAAGCHCNGASAEIVGNARKLLEAFGYTVTEPPQANP